MEVDLRAEAVDGVEVADMEAASVAVVDGKEVAEVRHYIPHYYSSSIDCRECGGGGVYLNIVILKTFSFYVANRALLNNFTLNLTVSQMHNTATKLSYKDFISRSNTL
jgi:hypothetical protein